MPAVTSGAASGGGHPTYGGEEIDEGTPGTEGTSAGTLIYGVDADGLARPVHIAGGTLGYLRVEERNQESLELMIDLLTDIRDTLVRISD